MLVLDYSSAHKFVNDQSRLGSDIRWDGWDIVVFKPTHYGFTSRNGAFRKNRWGVESRIPVDSDGKWRVQKRHAK